MSPKPAHVIALVSFKAGSLECSCGEILTTLDRPRPEFLNMLFQEHRRASGLPTRNEMEIGPSLHWSAERRAAQSARMRARCLGVPLLRDLRP